MSILIRGMAMPKNCDVCFMCDACEYSMPLGKRLTDCPLIEVPTPYGRLIDADALKNSLSFAENTAKWAVPALRAVLMVIDEMPTIIPPESEEE